MSFWFWHGLRNGIQSTRYPARAETAPGISPGRPVNTEFGSVDQALLAAAICPVDAIRANGRTGACRPGEMHTLPALPLGHCASNELGNRIRMGPHT